jgi:hemoglobin
MFRCNSASSLAVAALLLLVAARPAAARDTLFDQMGGETRLRATVETLVDVMLNDARINFTFAQTDLAKFKTLLYDQICELAGGPCKYTGRTMFEAHKNINATNAQFNALAEDLYIAFEKNGVPYRVQNKVMALLAPMQPEVVK